MRTFDLEPLTENNNYYLLSISDNGKMLSKQSEIRIIDRAKNKTQMKKDCLKMIFSDALICQGDCTMNNYGLFPHNYFPINKMSSLQNDCGKEYQ